MQDSQHDDPARNARQLPTGVIHMLRVWGNPDLNPEPCTNATRAKRSSASASCVRAV